MLQSLKFKIQFTNPAPGSKGQLHQSLTFQNGLTGITGPNEKGKSTILEMIRFALFGTAALRAPLKEYQAVSVNQTFTVESLEYHIHRTKTTAILTDATGTVLATGSSPVTARVERLLGYNLQVFDVANFCGQGNVMLLTNMKPTERKQMVDRVIGLNAMDTATKRVASERSLLQAQLKGLLIGISTKPLAPTEPPEYRVSAEIIAELEAAKPVYEQWLDAKAWLANAVFTKPTEPEPCRVTDTVEEIEAYQSARGSVKERVRNLERDIGDVSTPEFSAEELEQQKFLLTYGERPRWSQEELQEMLQQNAAAREREQIQVQLAAAPQATCPSCGTSFRFDDKELGRRLDALGDVEPHSFGDEVIHGLLRLRKLWDERGKPVLPVSRALGIGTVNRQLRAIAKEAQIQELASITVPPDRATDLNERISYEAELKSYDRQLSKWKETQADAAARRRIFEENQHIQALIEKLEFDKQQSLEYETRLNVFTEQYQNWEAKQGEVVALQEQIEQWDRAQKAIKVLRTRVKTYLMPSLNRVSSVLLSQMTGGQRSSITISDDFVSILVDGQSVETLSGSAKAVTNLAIRLALGRVLTNSVFSVFMGDEIDESMDYERANYMAECLKNLTGSVKQVILVSHKHLDVQHRITV